MAQINKIEHGDESPGILKRILALSLILTVIGTVTTFVMGITSLATNNDIKSNEYFISVAKDVQPNFEDSLVLYTGETQKIIDFLLSLRPASEEGYITFLTALEELGNKLSLHLDIKSISSISETEKKAAKEPSKTLEYGISFYGSLKNLKSLLKGIVELPYYVKVAEVRYSDPNGNGDGDENGDDNGHKLQNTYVRIKLYVK